LRPPNLRIETAADADEVERLTVLGFTAGHAERNIWQLRRHQPIADLCLVAEDPERKGRLFGSIRFWPITVAGRVSVLLGPLAVDPDLRGQGIGMTLVRQGLMRASTGQWHFCFVSGEPNYYPRVGFTKLKQGDVDLPAPIEEERLHMISVSGDSLADLPPPPWAIRPQDKIG
jgi:predicted N-acetyltransferase YhbS